MDRSDIVDLIKTTFTEQGLDPYFGLAICQHESNFNAHARSPISATDEKYGGAYGLAQITVATAKSLGFTGDPSALFDPNVNIQFFCALTRHNISTWKTNDINDLICIHNSGRPQYKAPAITINQYLPVVLKLYAKWKDIASDPFVGG